MVADPKTLAIEIAKSNKGLKGGEMPPPSIEMEIETEEGDEEDANLQIAADEVMGAFQSGDSIALKDALKAFIEMAK